MKGRLTLWQRRGPGHFCPFSPFRGPRRDFIKTFQRRLPVHRGEKSTGGETGAPPVSPPTGDTKSALMKPISSFLTTRRTSPPVIGERVKCQPPPNSSRFPWPCETRTGVTVTLTYKNKRPARLTVTNAL